MKTGGRTVYLSGSYTLNVRHMLLLAAVICLPAGLAQHKEGPLDIDPNIRSVEGTVTYAGNEPARGAVVKCKDTKTLEIRSYITGADGKYHFSNLSANVDYELWAEHNGKESRVETLSRFDGHKIANVNLRLK